MSKFVISLERNVSKQILSLKEGIQFTMKQKSNSYQHYDYINAMIVRSINHHKISISNFFYCIE